MKAKYSERYYKICIKNKCKLLFKKFVEDIFYKYTINLKYEI